MRRAVVIGATSGIGREIALLLLKEGWRIGIAGRREERLRELQAQCPERVCVRTVDIRKPGAEGEARALVDGERAGSQFFCLSIVRGWGIRIMSWGRKRSWIQWRRMLPVL